MNKGAIIKSGKGGGMFQPDPVRLLIKLNLTRSKVCPVINNTLQHGSSNNG